MLRQLYKLIYATVAGADGVASPLPIPPACVLIYPEETGPSADPIDLEERLNAGTDGHIHDRYMVFSGGNDHPDLIPMVFSFFFHIIANHHHPSSGIALFPV